MMNLFSSFQNKTFDIHFFWMIGLVVILYSCTNKIIHQTPGDNSVADRMMIITTDFEVDKEIRIDKEVIIYPSAMISTVGSGKIIFTKCVNILGQSQVFSENVNIEFGYGTLSALNPAWFGAKGYDDNDDTRAMQKTFKIAKDYTNSVNIEIPIGRFKISETLEIGNELPNGKSINLIGQSISNSSTLGSCMEWIGPPGKSAIIIKNYCAGTIENIDFFAADPHFLKHNIEMRPFDNQVTFRNCSFTGCAHEGSANVNINSANNLQVSEIAFENCIFRGIANTTKEWITESGVIGGLANTKNFYFKKCSFLGYNIAAINIEITDILNVENCTFGHNDIDVICLLCNANLTSNYCENSNSFFKSTVSNNISFTTMQNNYFFGRKRENDIIRDGSGGLVLSNNNFGGFGNAAEANRINWNNGKLSSIYSINNFFRNLPDQGFPFYTGGIRANGEKIRSYGDMIGTDGQNIKEIKLQKQN